MLSRGGVRQNLRRLYFQRMISKNINICTYLHGHFRVSELQLHQEMTLFDAIRFSCASNRHRKHVTPETKKTKTKQKYIYILGMVCCFHTQALIVCNERGGAATRTKREDAIAVTISSFSAVLHHVHDAHLTYYSCQP